MHEYDMIQMLRRHEEMLIALRSELAEQNKLIVALSTPAAPPPNHLPSEQEGYDPNKVGPMRSDPGTPSQPPPPRAAAFDLTELTAAPAEEK